MLSWSATRFDHLQTSSSPYFPQLQPIRPWLTSSLRRGLFLSLSLLLPWPWCTAPVVQEGNEQKAARQDKRSTRHLPSGFGLKAEEEPMFTTRPKFSLPVHSMRSPLCQTPSRQVPFCHRCIPGPCMSPCNQPPSCFWPLGHSTIPKPWWRPSSQSPSYLS